MNYRTLGRTGLEVSEIGFGCGNVGGLMVRGEHGDQVKAVARAMELGINYFDTASQYGDGQSETNLGRVLNELNAQVYVGTKYRLTANDEADIKGGVIASVDASLARMGREQVDLIQLHNRVAPQRDLSGGTLSVEDVLGEVVEATETLRAQGKVRFWGLTGVGVPESLHRVVDSGALCSVQTVYNLINASAGADVDPGFDMPDFKRIIDKSNAAGMGVIVIRVLAAGALSGVAERDPVAVPTVAPIGSGRDYQQDFDRSEGFRFLVNEGFANDLVEASVRFALSNKGVSTVLVGYSNLDHLEQSVRFSEKGPLPSEALARLPQVWAQFVE